MSTVCYLFVKTETGINTNQVQISSEAALPTETTDEVEGALNRSSENLTGDQNTGIVDQNQDFIGRMNPNVKRTVGIVLAVISGVLYGESNTPVLLSRDKSETSTNYLDFLFSFYTGILITSLLYFIIYCAVKKNKPNVYPQVILPALASGNKYYSLKK